MTSSAELQKISVNNPATGYKHAEVMLQPINMQDLAQVVGWSVKEKTKLNKYVNEIVFNN